MANGNGNTIWSKILVNVLIGIMGLLLGYAISPAAEKIEQNRIRTENNLQRISELCIEVETDRASRQAFETYMKETMTRIELDIKELKGK